jgi:G3E family GTPase
LIRILGNLMKRKDRFDYILIETTGMADPGPVAQTFFVDDEMQSKMRLDGIVTLVDAKHVWEHIDDSDEVKEQIAFADVILLNKIDLVSSEDVDRLEARIKSMNAASKIYRTQNAEIDIEKILHVGGFNLDRAMEVDPQFMEPEYPFEWGGIYQLEAGTYQLTLQPGPDPEINVALLPTQKATAEDMASRTMDAVLLFSNDEQVRRPGEVLDRTDTLYQLALQGQELNYPLSIEQPGFYALYTQHHPTEFQLELRAASGPLTPVVAHDYKPKHEHDDEVSSVGIDIPGDLDPRKLNDWLGALLRNQGPDIFRMKGVLSIKGADERYVFQGVHMLFDGRPDRPWGNTPRRNSLIFIGRNLNREQLNKGFKACLATM